MATERRHFIQVVGDLVEHRQVRWLDRRLVGVEQHRAQQWTAFGDPHHHRRWIVRFGADADRQCPRDVGRQLFEQRGLHRRGPFEGERFAVAIGVISTLLRCSTPWSNLSYRQDSRALVAAG